MFTDLEDRCVFSQACHWQKKGLKRASGPDVDTLSDLYTFTMVLPAPRFKAVVHFCQSSSVFHRLRFVI